MLSKWEKELEMKKGRVSVPVKQEEPILKEPAFHHSESWNGKQKDSPKKAEKIKVIEKGKLYVENTS